MLSSIAELLAYTEKVMGSSPVALREYSLAAERMFSKHKRGVQFLLLPSRRTALENLLDDKNHA